MENRETAALSAPERLLAFEFLGRANEYFKIWIVNVCLTVLTLGVYSAWAKVRTRRYFYRNVRLDDHIFDYHAAPIAILKGRIIAVSVLGGTYAMFLFHPIAGMALIGVLFLLSPWIVNQASRFNARVTSYRNVRFGFAGTYGRAFVAICLWPFVGVVTAGLLFPLAAQQRSAYFMKNHRFGATSFSGKPSVGAFYLLALQVVGLVLLVLVPISAVGAFLAMDALRSAAGNPMATPLHGPATALLNAASVVCFAFVVLPFARAKVRNAVLNGLELGRHRFRSNLSGWRYAWITLSNLLLAVTTAGLMFPWGQIRLARYVASRTSMVAASDLSEFAAEPESPGSVTASELAVLEGLAIGIGA